MKIFLLFAAMIVILFAANPTKTTSSSDNNEIEPACFNKNKCSESEKGMDDFYPLQFNPIHI
jgi:hypothetical protein